MNIVTARILQKKAKSVVMCFFDNEFEGTVLESHLFSEGEEGSVRGGGEVLIEDLDGRNQWYPLHFVIFKGEE